MEILQYDRSFKYSEVCGIHETKQTSFELLEVARGRVRVLFHWYRCSATQHEMRLRGCG